VHAAVAGVTLDDVSFAHEAPWRDVTRIEELRGPRGGRMLVMHLSCGCFLTRSSRLPPPKRARCTPCAVLAAHPDLAVVVLNRRELELVHRLVEHRTHVDCTEEMFVDGLLLGLARAKSQWAQRGGDR